MKFIVSQLAGKVAGYLVPRARRRKPYDTVAAAFRRAHHYSQHGADAMHGRWAIAEKRLHNRYCKFYSRYLMEKGVKRQRL